MDSCGSCGETSIEPIHNNGEDELVCTSCGVVQERGFFASDASSQVYVGNRNSLFPDQSVPVAIRSLAIPFKSEGLKVGNKKIAQLLSVFHLSPDMSHEVYMFFGRALNNRHFLLWTISKKTVLAGCCLYVVMRQHNWPVTVSNVCSALCCSRSEFSCVYLKFLELFSLSISMPPIEELMEGFMKECKGLEEAEKGILLNRSLLVLGIAKDCWLTSGRMPRPLLLAAVYLSWQSLKSCRIKVALNGFCRQMGLTVQCHANLRKRELFCALCKLAAHLPWHEENKVTPRNLSFYLEDILKYSQTLLRECEPNEKTFKFVSEKDQRLQSSQETELCFVDLERPTPRVGESYKGCLHSTEGYGDIFEEEIDSYIRSKDEVELIQKINSAFSPHT